MTHPSGTTLSLPAPPPYDRSTNERIRAAAEELLAAETVDLSTATRPTLVLFHERLRSALADMLRVVHHD